MRHYGLYDSQILRMAPDFELSPCDLGAIAARRNLARIRGCKAR
ncbi:unnamed protein product, partial [marine sediment metagenome]